LIGALSAALLSDDADLHDVNADDAEAALFEGLHAFEALLGEHIPELLSDLPACACMFVIACVTLPARLVAEGGGAMLVGAGAVFLARRTTTQSADRAWEAFAPLLDDLSTAVRGRVELVASGSCERFLTGLQEKTRHWRAISGRASLFSFLAGRAPALGVAFAAGLVLILDEGLRGTIAHGVLGRAALLASMSPAFAGLARAWLELGKSRARVRPVAVRIERHARPKSIGEEPPPLPALVALDRVAFTYSTCEPAVLNELVATWRPGEVLVLTGSNGSGKSTLLALLLGLVRPLRGSISVAGHDLESIDPRLWRQHIGYLSQRPFLPDRATVGEAMRLIAPDAEREELERALIQVKLWPVLSNRSPRAPLDARVGSLSAGEKQRLALARVLARRSPLLLLDEPDANLDAEGLELLATLLRELAPGRMIVVAAHSPRLIEAADRILALGGSSEWRLSPAPLELQSTALQPEGTRS
jgi:ABC-type multidrug transport system fused ATPase/permease subunit